MAQGTTINSTGTTLSGGEGSGTHSAILNALNTLRYLKLLKAIDDGRRWLKGRSQEDKSKDDEPIEPI